jgi:dynein heavy chain
MTDLIHLVFEVGDLTQASLATVSRCGMVYYDPGDLPWQTFRDSWFVRYTIREEGKDLISMMLSDVMPRVLHLRSVVCLPTGFETLAIFVDATLRSFPEMENDIPDAYVRKMRQIFVWSFAWAFGWPLDGKRLTDFDAAIRESFESKSSYPNRRTIFDYFLDTGGLTFVPWSQTRERASWMRAAI